MCGERFEKMMLVKVMHTETRNYPVIYIVMHMDIAKKNHWVDLFSGRPSCFLG